MARKNIQPAMALVAYTVMCGARSFGTFVLRSQAESQRSKLIPIREEFVHVVEAKLYDVGIGDFVASPPCDVCGSRELYYIDNDFRCINCY